MTAIYLLLSFAFVAVVPMQQIQSNTAFVAQFGQALFGAAGGRVLSACVVLCVLGGLMVLSMAVPRVTYALARGEAGDRTAGASGCLRRACIRASASPANAVLLQTGMALLVLVLGAFDRILAFIIFSAVVFLALTVATLFRVDHPGARAGGFRSLPSSSSPAAECSPSMLLMHNPGSALLGAGVCSVVFLSAGSYAPQLQSALVADRFHLTLIIRRGTDQLTTDN